jgi:adenylate kinase
MEDQIIKITQWLNGGSINMFGRPFAGKDTQGQILANLFDTKLIGGGDILRSYEDQDVIEKYMAIGDLIPSDLYEQIVVPFLEKQAVKDKPIILSAVGRMHGEEEMVINAMKQSGHPIKAVVLMNMSEEEVFSRFDNAKSEHDRGDRADDNRNALAIRLRKFQEKTIPVIEFYRNHGLLIEVDGMLTRNEVTQEILDSLYKKATQEN